jgi:hypothetical protein
MQLVDLVTLEVTKEMRVNLSHGACNWRSVCELAKGHNDGRRTLTLDV